MEKMVLAAIPAKTTYDRLYEKIVRGEYPPTTRLVNRVVAEELGVSVVPVREALGRLTSEGLVEHIPGAGSFVRSLDSRELAKLYALREHLEVFAVVEAARHAQGYHVQHLQRCCDESAAALQAVEDAEEAREQREAVEAWVASDAAFHSALIEAADNPWLGMAVDRLRVLAHIARAKPRDLETNLYRQALQEHEAIAKAIESHDEVQAESIMRTHIQRAMAAVLARNAENF